MQNDCAQYTGEFRFNEHLILRKPFIPTYNATKIQNSTRYNEHEHKN